ncbi:MAG: NepR family anti-sigma factor [Pseudomonadota bacterium]
MNDSDGKDKSHKLIEDNLKRVYQQTVDEEMPDRFKDLLARLKDSDAASSKNGDGGAK